MTSGHLVDPELRDALAAFPALPLSREGLPMLRAGLAAMLAEAPAPPEGAVTVESRTLPGPPGAPDVRVLVYTPRAATGLRPAILHLHGGGYILGRPEIGDAANRQLAAELDCIILSADYRLAPETPHPGPVEDCYAALAWLHGEADSLGVDAGRIGVMGESAGGGLAASLALLARDRGEFALAFQHLIYPMIDDRTGLEADPNPFTGEFVWTRSMNSFGWAALLGEAPGSAGVSPYAAAARAEDLSGLPPAFIAVGALDLFLDENLTYAGRLARAGVPIELHVYPGAFHGFQQAAAARVTQLAERDSREALRRRLHP